MVATTENTQVAKTLKLRNYAQAAPNTTLGMGTRSGSAGSSHTFDAAVGFAATSYANDFKHSTFTAAIQTATPRPTAYTMA